MNELKQRTCLAWIDFMQKQKSPIDVLLQRGIKEVVVYGIADLGERFVEEAIQKGYSIKGITDTKVIKGNYCYRDIPVIKRSDLRLSEYQGVSVVVTSMTFWEEIREQLNEYKIVNIIPLLELMR